MSCTLRIPVAPDLSDEQRQNDSFGAFIKKSAEKLLCENEPDSVLDDLGQLDSYIHYLLHPYIGRENWASTGSSPDRQESVEYAFRKVRSHLKQIVRSVWIQQNMKDEADILQLIESVAKGRFELKDVLEAEPSLPVNATDLLHLVARYSYRTAADIILEDLHQPYIGDGVEILLSHLKWVGKKHANDPKHARFVPFLQSSGSGKTRIVLELCKQQIGVYTCVRKPEQQGLNELHVSAPGADTSVLKMLASEPYSDDTPGKTVRELATWLKAMAQTLYELCLDLIEKAENGGTRKTFDLPREVDKYLNDFERPEASDLSTRDAFFADVEELTLKFRQPDVISSAWRFHSRNDDLEGSQGRSSNYVNVWAQFMQGSFDRLDAVLAGWQADPRIEWKDLGSWIGEAAELSEAKRMSDGFMFLAIDHASSLGHGRLDLLKELLSCLGAKHFWVLLLDTDLGLGRLADSGPNPESLLRSRTSRDACVFTPYQGSIASPIHSDYDSVLNGTKHIDYRHLTSYMRVMGRPLWNCSHLNLNVEKFDSVVADRNLTQIYAKLTGFQAERPESSVLSLALPFDTAEQHDEGPMLGALAQRVHFARGDNHASGGSYTSDFMDNQVLSHLRTVERVSWNFVTSVPSEPLISLSVADHARKHQPEKWWSRAIEDLKDHVQIGRLDFDTSGVQGFQILLNLAMDMALKQHHRLEADGIPVHLMPINALAYLRQLFGANVHLSTGTEIWAKEHWLNFTHFLQPYEDVYTADTPIPRLDYMGAFTCQGAIVANIEQAKWKILLPAYRSKAFGPDTRVDPRAFDAIAIEIQAGQKAKPRKQEWNADHNESVVKDSSSCQDLNIFVNLNADKAQFRNPEEADNGRLAIYAGGHSAEQYPSESELTQEGQASLEYLLDRRPFFGLPLDARTQALHNGTGFFIGARQYPRAKRRPKPENL